MPRIRPKVSPARVGARVEPEKTRDRAPAPGESSEAKSGRSAFDVPEPDSNEEKIGVALLSALAVEVAHVGVSIALDWVSARNPLKAADPRPPQVFSIDVTTGIHHSAYKVEVSAGLLDHFASQGWTFDPRTLEAIKPDGARQGLVGQEAYLEETGEVMPAGVTYDQSKLHVALPTKGLILSLDKPGRPTFATRGSIDLSGKLVHDRAAAAWNKPVPAATIAKLKPRWDAARKDWQALATQLAALKAGDPRLARVQAVIDQRMDASTSVRDASGSKDGESDGAVIGIRDWKAADTQIDRWAAQKKPFSVDAMCELNGIFGKDLLNNNHRPGELRNFQVSGGGSYLHAYIYSDQLATALGDFTRWHAAAVAEGMPAVQLAAQSFQRLISIHPFADGNGRTTRAIMDWTLKQAGLPPATFAKGKGLIAVYGRFPPDKQHTPEEAVVAVTEAIENTVNLYRQALEGRSWFRR